MKKILIMTCAAAVAVLGADATETVAHWTFGANGLTDITGNNTIALENHGVTFTNGAAFFDGNSYFVTTTPVTLGATTKAFTIECWVRFEAMNYLGYIFAPEDPTQKGAFVVYQNPSVNDPYIFGQLRVVAPSTWQQETYKINSAGTSYPHHIAYVVDAAKSGTNQAKLYFDGKEVSNSGLTQSGDFSDGFGSRKLYIGIHGNNGSPSNGFKGRIDDIRITDGALEPSQFLKFPTVGDAMTPANPAFAHWTFGANGATDVSGNGHNLTAAGSPVFDDGTLSLNGSSRLYSGSALPLSQFFTSGLTMECFFRTTETFDESDARILLETSNGNTGYSGTIGSFHLSLRTSGTVVAGGLRCDGSGYNTQRTTGTPPLNDGRWHHAAVVYDPSLAGTKDVIRTYVDGVVVPDTDTNTAIYQLADAPLYVGARQSNTLNVTADMDEVRIMPYALAPSEFLKSPTPNAPVAHWKFGSATPLVDATGNGNDLVNSGVTFANGAAVFSGSGQHLKTASTLDLSAWRRATIECRYHANTHDKFGVLFALDNTGSTTPGSFVVYKYVNNLFGQFGTATGWHQDNLAGLSASSPYCSAGWHHIAYILDVSRDDNDECVLYVDGVRQNATQNRTVVLSALLNDKFCIGGGSSYGSNQATTFDGTMSEIIVTPQVLTTNSFKLARNPSSGSGVIAYWDFSGGNGSWVDKSGNGHTLTAANVGKKKGAAKFDSASASLDATLDLSGCRSVTVECFAKSDASGALFTSGDGSAAGSFGAFKSVGGSRAEFVPYADALNSESAAADGEWHHYALVIDDDASGAEQARFYVDGVRAASGALASGMVTLLNGTFRIGVGYDGTAFTGLIDDVRITSGALAPEEFMQPEDRTEVLPGLMIKVM